MLSLVAQRYFLEDRSKVQIAEEIGVSRFRVARMLEQARELGIVHISVEAPSDVDLDASRRLAERYGLRQALVLSGVDLKEFGSGAATAPAGEPNRVDMGERADGRLPFPGALPPHAKPLIGAINGVAVTGGLEITSTATSWSRPIEFASPTRTRASVSCPAGGSRSCCPSASASRAPQGDESAPAWPCGDPPGARSEDSTRCSKRKLLRSSEDFDFAIRALLAGHFVYETPSIAVTRTRFRPWAQGQLLIDGYMFGMGATYAKLLRFGGLPLLKPLLALGWRWLAGRPVVDLNHLPPRLPRLAAFLRGARAGAFAPLDRSSGRFRRT